MRTTSIAVIALLMLGCADPDISGAPATERQVEDQADAPEVEQPEPDEAADLDDQPDEPADPGDGAEVADTGEVDGDGPVVRYLEAFVTSRASDMQAMLEVADAGSPAAVYAELQIATVSALQQEGFPQDPSRLTPTDTGFELCSGDVTQEGACNHFADLEVVDGMLRSFTVDDVAIADRLAAGGQVAQQADTTVELIGAYHSVQADSLIVALDVTNGADTTLMLNPYTAEYVTMEGRQVTAADAFGPIDLRAGVSAYVVLAFPAQGVGGTVYLTGSADDFMTDLEWELALTPMDG